MLNERLMVSRAWFTLSIKSSAAPADISVYAFSGREHVHEPYEFAVEFVSRSRNMDLTDLLGCEALLTITDRSGDQRVVHGLIREAKQLHTAGTFTHYLCKVVPRLWFLSQTQDQRIYQHLRVNEIIETVFAKHNFTAGSYVFQLKNEYPKREYCVQYGESDLHFVSRICEEEGIYFFFEHTPDAHRIRFCDTAGGPPIPGEDRLRFYPGSGQPAETAVITRLNLAEQINSDEATYREWNFTTPSTSLHSARNEPDGRKAPVPPAMKLETYTFPHLYQTPREGERYAALQLERQLTWRTWISAEADVSRLTPGYSFALHSHPRQAANREWCIVSVEHAGEQPGVLEHEAPEERGLKYVAAVKAIPQQTRYVPPLQHPKMRIEGVQSAVVTGPASEDVFPDKYGRVKVKLHWDRSGARDETTTCWVRVADTWAGVNFGSVMLPRIGQEVLVTFMEGDPDRPVITGRVYNTANMPPWTLPGQKALSGIQSREFGAERRNQLVMDDTSGQIQTQLSSDHGATQLNLGYLTRVDHGSGRKDFRGEGFELRTDDWGAVRAGKGLVLTTDTRLKARNHQKDVAEAVERLQHAAKQHRDTGDLAAAHNAQEGAEVSALSSGLSTLTDEVRGGSGAHGELTRPHLVLSSPAGLAVTTPGTAHIHTGADTAVSSGGHCSVSTGESFLAAALGRVSLFAHKLGMRLFAARGKVEIQAQSDELEIIAQKVINIISAQETVKISAAREILLTAGGSYVSVSGRGIEQGTPGSWKVHAAQRSMGGPKSKEAKLPVLPSGGKAGGAEASPPAPQALGQAAAAGPSGPAPAAASGSVWEEGRLPADWLDAASGRSEQAGELSAALRDSRDRAALLSGSRPPRPGEAPVSETARAAWQALSSGVDSTAPLSRKVEMVEQAAGSALAVTEGGLTLPDVTLAALAGSSLSLALVKVALLEQAGVPPEDMEVVIVSGSDQEQPPAGPATDGQERTPAAGPAAAEPRTRERAVVAVRDGSEQTPGLLLLDSGKGRAAYGRPALHSGDTPVCRASVGR